VDAKEVRITGSKSVERAADDIYRGKGSVPSRVPTGQIASQSELASLERANEWLNSPPLTAADLRGKVVLIQFWTFTCINWLRTFPYVRAWAEKYRDLGLVVIGVHAPEFAFEKDGNNVRRAVEEMRVDYQSITRSQWTMSMSYGKLSETNIGRRCISSTRRVVFDIIISARAPTNNRKRSFKNCWPRPESPSSAMSLCRSTPAVLKRQPIGAV
jgi:thiol-disulfide isomerase/thioredoxin